MIKKSFSLLLALRYLNPLRTHVSVITMISLAGVATGVMVLVVVLSVFGGFEQLLKERILSYTPHITVMRNAPWPDDDLMRENDPEYNAEAIWRDLETKMSKLDGVQSAYPLVSDFVLLDRGGSIAPAQLQAIDTQNPAQVESLQKLIGDKQGTADMGVGETAVISSLAAEKFGIHLGDTIQVHSARNLEQIKPVLDRLGSGALATTQAELLEQIHSDLKPTIRDGKESISIESLLQTYRNDLQPLLDHDLRTSEKQIIRDTLILLEGGERTTAKPDNSGNFLFPLGHLAKVTAKLDELKKIDPEKADAEEIRSMKSLILPKDLVVVGVYQATRHAFSPEIFVPLHVGQDVSGLGDKVIGIALRLDDPYKAHQVMKDVVEPNIPGDGEWRGVTWMEDHQQQFGLVKTQRQLLTFALSFIMLVSTFSIAAVMFTVTIQKKREIGVMKALGATSSQLVRVFLYQGIIIGLLGSILGTVLGYIVIENRNRILELFASMGFDPFPSDFNGFDGLPAIKNPQEFAVVFVFAFVTCVLATYIPALIASRSDAAKSLRNM